MKISPSNHAAKQQGGTLFITLILMGILCVVLLTTMNMVSGERTIVARAHVWNAVIPMCESGVEDAMAMINYSGNNASYVSNGWTYTGSSYWRSNTLNTANGTKGYYIVSMTATNPPVITSQGFVLAPEATNVYITRTVQVHTRQNGLFPEAVLVKGIVNVNGIASINSFNSTNAAFNTFGQYDPLKAEANANVDSISTASGAINLGNGKIYGTVDTGAGGTVSVGNGAVGTNTAWVNSNSGIETNCSAANLNTIIPDAVLPSFGSSPLTPQSGIVGLTPYSYVLSAGNYTLPGLTMTGGSSMYISGNCILYVSGNVDIRGTSAIYLGPGASLQIYVAGSSCSIGGGGIVNTGAGQTAANLSIIGLPTCTTVDYGGNAGLVGTIYAPEANCTYHGGGDMTGAIVANSLTMSGSISMHYDEALGGPAGYKYLANSWTEL